MAKLTLLDMVQNILSAMDGDEVNSISDTVESMQVAEVIRETYSELFGNVLTASLKGLVQLDGLGNPALPNYLRIPEDVQSVDWIKYDYQTDGQVDYQMIGYLPPEDFVKRVSQQSSTTAITVVDPIGVSFYINTDQPRYWTTFDNNTAVFDGFNAASETTLHQERTLCWGTKATTFEMSDDFVPILDDSKFPLLLAESKSVCFLYQKQVSSSKDEQRSKRQRVKSLNNEWRFNQRKPYNRLPDYGRKH